MTSDAEPGYQNPADKPMRSGKLKPKPSDIARKKLMSRTNRTMILSGVKVGKLPESAKKSPSQRKSESARKKFAKRAGLQNVQNVYPSDCRDCDEKCGYDRNLEKCYRHSLVLQCDKCGKKVRVRIIPGEDWRLCPSCR